MTQKTVLLECRSRKTNRSESENGFLLLHDPLWFLSLAVCASTDETRVKKKPTTTTTTIYV